MAVPVISLPSSILQYIQWQEYEFIAVATNGPITWTSTALPTGMTLNASTGRIYGTPSVPGVCNVTLTATNGTAESSKIDLVFGVRAAAFAQHSGVDLSIDVANGGKTASEDMVAQPDLPIIEVKEGDDLLCYIRWKRKGTILDLPITKLQFAFREFASESTIILGNTFAKKAAGQLAHCILHVKFDREKLTMLADYEDDVETGFIGVADIEWVETNTTNPLVGPATIRRTTQSFRVKVVRDFGEVP
jgi:hypothetical protein